MKELAQIRGFTNVKYDVKCPSSDYVVATCSIDWIPNFETENKPVTFSAIGDASPMNTNSFVSIYLGATAENRAFVRCVRNFLKINIVAADELGAKGAAAAALQQDTQSAVKGSDLNPKDVLSSLMQEKGISFDSVKKRLKEEGYEPMDKLNEVGDIPNIKTFELIERLKKVKT